MNPVLRSLSLGILLASVTAAQAVVAYSNKPALYESGGWTTYDPYFTGMQFTSSATGELSSFDVAINNAGAAGPTPFTLYLYSDNGGTMDNLLGTYAGTSTGLFLGDGTTYAHVLASGVTLNSGSSYWLVAKASDILVWCSVGGGATQNAYFSTDGSNYRYEVSGSAAFSVNLAAVPGPTAAVPFALMALRRRRSAGK